MSKNIVSPRSVSFEDALRNLAGRLTGCPAAELPRTQEGIVQFMAENVPTPDEMAEAIAQEVLDRLEAAAVPTEEEPGQGPPTEDGEQEDPDSGQQEAPAAADKPKRGKAKTAK